PVAPVAAVAVERTEPASESVGVESFLPGGVLENASGRVYLHERLRSEIERPNRKWGRYKIRPARAAFLHEELAGMAGRGLGGAVYLDLETCGLTNASVFLAGTMHWNGTDFVVRQYFARDYAEEAALVHELIGFLTGFETLITYNGKSYDVPFLTDRANLHRMAFVPPPRHLDLVHHARRRWAGEFPNCRLVTLELYVCGRRRSGDIPSSEVPGLYHDYVRYGAAHRLIPVFHHNLIDVITMDEILRALIEDTAATEFASYDLE
ncbi:MAG: ribonuclease H-like domain-containing protein, partial [Candidatus Eiseniibacteriota bacterium]